MTEFVWILFMNIHLFMIIIFFGEIYLQLPASPLFGRSCLLLCALPPIYELFSDLSKIWTSADQHSAQTTHILPPTASSLHSGDGKAQLSTFKQTRGNASRGIYMLHELPQTSTKDCGSWFGFIHHIKYSHILYKAYIEQWTTSTETWGLILYSNEYSCYINLRCWMQYWINC